MPAINLPKLRQDCVRLAAEFEYPRRFIRQLDELLNYYANRSQRAGQTGKPRPLINSYNVPKPVVRQVLSEMIPLIASHPAAILNLCDALWEEPNYEFRIIAAHLLGQINSQPPEVILKRVVYWSTPLPEDRLLDAIYGPGLVGLLRESPDALLSQISAWLSESEVSLQRSGLLALKSLISSENFENHPLLFHLISPLIRAHPADLRSEMRAIIQEIARRSPVETAYYLRQVLEITQSTDAAWLARQCLPLLPRDSQESLRSVLRNISTGVTP